MTGIDVDIARLIFKKLNINADFQIHPWTRAWAKIEKGEADAVFSASRKDKRKPYLYYPKEDMWKSEYVFFVHKDDKKTKFRGYQDAKGLKVGIIRGNSYHESFWKAKLITEEVKNMDLNFKKLNKKRIDLFPCDKTVGLYSLKLMKLQDNITYYDFIIFSKGYPMSFAKKSSYPNIEKIAKSFEKELIQLKKSGEYDKIMKKWLK